ncbi:MAG: acetoin dehydrogenase [Chloroflexi bacterium]|nr:acetoin dehydrogenase [Chloroflexota bacterium]|tara:strand:+ start:3843 stop:4808 length:966 start_codon:yes stop_codon:yes gene_type:complete
MNITLVERLYEELLKIRLIEEEISYRYSEEKMRCPTHIAIGQEAAAVGVCASLNKNDYAVSGHRAHHHYIAKGGNIKKLIAEIYGKETGCSGGKGGSMHLIDTNVGFMGSTAIVAGTIPVGVGLSFSQKLKHSENITCIFFGDAAIEEGVFYESVNFAILKNLPVLFVCENNQFSCFTHLSERQPQNRKIFEMVSGLGIDSSECDGNDVIAVQEKTAQLVNKIKKGEGPKFLELHTYRWLEHCGPNYDDELGYRTINDIKKSRENDPIIILEKKYPELIKLKKHTILKNLKTLTKNAFKFAEESNFPNQEEAYENLYSEKL